MRVPNFRKRPKITTKKKIGQEKENMFWTSNITQTKIDVQGHCSSSILLHAMGKVEFNNSEPKGEKIFSGQGLYTGRYSTSTLCSENRFKVTTHLLSLSTL